MSRHSVACGLLLGLWLISGTQAHADIITYFVEFDQTGDVALGSTLNWNLYAQVMGEGDPNFGIETLSVSLQNNTGEMMSPAAIAAPFADYTFDSTGDASTAGQLVNVGATLFFYDPGAVEGANPPNGGSLAPLLLATGSYQVNTIGIHTLEALFLPGTSVSEFFVSGADGNTEVDQFTVTYGPAAEVNVLAAVPEPASLAMMGLAACGAFGLRRRRKGAPSEQAV